MLKRMLIKSLLAVLIFSTAAWASEPLPSWNDGPAKQGIISFVEKITKEGTPSYVPPADRIATFDNDGTLWSERPVPVQLYFALDRVKALAPLHPEWNTQEPFASLLKGDVQKVLAGGDHAVLDLFMATHAGMTTTEFEQIVRDWIATARHPDTGRLYTDMIYQPMLEVLTYLRANGFKTYIVSGGGIEFMRPWAERIYGIPPEQVIGSSIKTRFEMRDGQPILVRLPELNFNDDKAGKPVAINQHIGRRPIAAFGNSDGDREMLEYTQGGSGERFELLVLHDDAAREFAYGPAQGLPDAKLGAFTQALYGEAKTGGWTIASMKDDWRTVFPSDIVAVDVLLQPDATMLQHAAADNARLRGAFPTGFALDETHTPHITMMQAFVRRSDLSRMYADLDKVFSATDLSVMTLEASSLYYIPAGGGLGVAGIVATATPELRKLQSNIIAAVAPFNLRGGPIGAFTAPHDNPAIDAGIIAYVARYEEIGAGERFDPHVSTGNAPTAYLDQMIAEPFVPFSFSPTGAAVFQLGPFGTAAKKLKEWDLKR
jgi:phosphoserine phosphatase